MRLHVSPRALPPGWSSRWLIVPLSRRCQWWLKCFQILCPTAKTNQSSFIGNRHQNCFKFFNFFSFSKIQEGFSVVITLMWVFLQLPFITFFFLFLNVLIWAQINIQYFLKLCRTGVKMAIQKGRRTIYYQKRLLHFFMSYLHLTDFIQAPWHQNDGQTLDLTGQQ